MAPQISFTDFTGNIINGQLASSKAKRYSVNPSTGERLYDVPHATKDDLDAAVKYARQAFRTWSRTVFDLRAKHLCAFADAIAENRDSLEKLHVMEQGCPQSLAHLSMDMTLEWLRVFSTMELKDEVLEDNDERMVYLNYAPIGVCGAIIPWNAPILLGMAKVGSALMTGNTIIMKPSPFTPYCGLKIGEIAMSIFPPGVFQVLSGDNDLGSWMTGHSDIDMISFTGSIPTGKRVAEVCSKTLKRYVLELGGNDPAIVCEDVNMAKCVPQLSLMSFINSGQVCMAPKRIFIHDKIYENFRNAMAEFTKNNVRTGEGFDRDVTVGPLQNETQFEGVKNMLTHIDKCGLRTALSGRVRESEGYLIEPTIVDNPPQDSLVTTENPFGPIVSLLKWSADEDVVDQANSLRTGLGASVWTEDLKRAEKMARQLSAGTVWINSGLELSAKVPFGGHKESGFGVECGIEGLKQYTNRRSIWISKLGKQM